MICLPQSQNNTVKFMCFVVSPVLHDSKLGCVKPSWDQLCAHNDHPYPSPHLIQQDWLPIHTEFWALNRQYPESLSHGPVISLIGSHSSYSPWSEPQERESWLLFRLSFCLLSLRFLGCLELFPNSHLILKECSPWVCLRSNGLPPTWLSWEPSVLSGLEPDSLLLASFETLSLQ
jgi:hypothetical protein